MNAKQVIAQLQPLTGHDISLLTDNGYRTMHVAEVRHLPPDERVDGGGNVIVDKGTVDADGWPEGLVFWARSVRAVEWYKGNVALVRKEGIHRIWIEN